MRQSLIPIDETAPSGTGRRRLLRGVAAGVAAASAGGLPAPIARARELSRESASSSDDSQRIRAAEKIRTDMASLSGSTSIRSTRPTTRPA